MFESRRKHAIPELEMLGINLREAAGATRPQVRRVRRFALAGAIAFVTAVALVILLAAGRDSGPLSTEAALAEVARATLAAGDASPSQFTYTRFEDYTYAQYPDPMFSKGLDPAARGKAWPGKPFVAQVTRPIETWVSIERPGFVNRMAATPTYPSETDRVRGQREIERRERSARAHGHTMHFDAGAGTGSYVIGDNFNPSSSETYGFARQKHYSITGRNMTLRQVRAFPTEPHAIVRRLRKGMSHYAGVDRDGALWSELTGPFVPGYGVPFPAKLRAGFVRALALVPGVISHGEVTDSRGRAGLSFSKSWGALRQDLTFDSDSGTLLESKSIIVSKSDRAPFENVPVGTVVQGFTLVDTKVTDRLPTWVLSNLKRHTTAKKRRELAQYFR